MPATGRTVLSPQFDSSVSTVGANGRGGQHRCLVLFWASPAFPALKPRGEMAAQIDHQLGLFALMAGTPTGLLAFAIRVSKHRLALSVRPVVHRDHSWQLRGHIEFVVPASRSSNWLVETPGTQPVTRTSPP